MYGTLAITSDIQFDLPSDVKLIAPNILGVPKSRYGHFHSYLTIAFEFFGTPNIKRITDKFLINFEKMAVRRGLSKFLHGLKVDAISEWVNRV